MAGLMGGSSNNNNNPAVDPGAGSTSDSSASGKEAKVTTPAWKLKLKVSGGTE
jgi:hypothetical protein